MIWFALIVGLVIGFVLGHGYGQDHVARQQAKWARDHPQHTDHADAAADNGK
jgi:hypothetical protein